MIENLNGDRVFIFAKDQHGKFLFCNECHAEIAGIDSAGQIIGKSDKDLFWKQHADQCREGDLSTMSGYPWKNVTEKLTRVDGTFDICISKFQLLDDNDNCIGVVGSYFDIKKYPNKLSEDVAQNANMGKIYLGACFGDEYFTAREYEVFNHLLMGKSTKQIARDLCISPKTAEYHIDRIKKKLQCTYKQDIIITAIKYGLVSLDVKVNTTDHE